VRWSFYRALEVRVVKTPHSAYLLGETPAVVVVHGALVLQGSYNIITDVFVQPTPAEICKTACKQAVLTPLTRLGASTSHNIILYTACKI
jgi:hypothetical protein